MTLYLEQYLDSLETLPVDLRRNFNLMHDLDSRTQLQLQNVDKMVSDYLRNVASLSGEKRNKQVDEVMKTFAKTKSLSDDKVQLATQTYELVDKHIRKLDSDLARFEDELKDKFIENQFARPTTLAPNPKKRKGRKSDVSKTEYDDEIPNISAKKRKKFLAGIKSPGGAGTSSMLMPTDAATISGLSGTALLNTIAGASGDVLDMPVDPNEPTYCVCGQVSYGEMIGCDNQDCTVEWFHFPCVDLTNKPKGKWYCPKCSDARKKK